MSIFDAQHVRTRAGLEWGEDYVLGLIEKTAPISNTRIVDLAKKQGIMSSPTAQKYITSVIEKELVVKKPDQRDGRLAYYSLTEKGKRMVRSLRDAVK